jgi:hypothetical protein
MKRIYLINFSLCEKIADKKNGITTEDAAAYITCVEIFFTSLIAEFLVMRILPFKLNDFLVYGTMAIVWYFTHYILRKSLRKKITDLGIRKMYKQLDKSEQKNYLILSILIFFAAFFIFFIAAVWMIGGYNKRWH